MVKENMAKNVIGGHLASVCMKCYLVRRLFMPSPWLKHMEKS